MKLIATSEIPTRVQYVHFGYLAAAALQRNFALIALLVIAGFGVGRLVKKIFRRTKGP